MTEMTIEAATIELNRLKSQERMDIDRERMTAAIDKLIEAGRFRIKRKPLPDTFYYGYGKCPSCGVIFTDNSTNCCRNCGQALDWGD